MTAAERQQRCRDNGKGRHRGRRYTRAQIRALLQAPPTETTPAPAATTAPPPSLPAPAHIPPDEPNLAA